MRNQNRNEPGPATRAVPIVASLVALALWGAADVAEARPLATNPDAGNNSLSAVFDAAIGERIMAVSSAVDCTLEVDDSDASPSPGNSTGGPPA